MDAAAAAKSLQSCLTLCDPIDCNLPGSSVHGILQARTLEWVAISLSKRNYRKKDSEVTQSCPTLGNPVDCNPPGSSVHGILQARIMEWVAISISRDVPDPGIEPRSPSLEADTLPSEPPGSTIKRFKTAKQRKNIRKL